MKRLKTFESFNIITEAVKVEVILQPFGGDKVPRNELKDFQEGVMVAPRMSYKDKDELSWRWGRVTEVGQDKVTYKRIKDGELVEYAPNELYILDVGE